MKYYFKYLVFFILATQSTGCASSSLSQNFKQVDPSVVVIHTSDAKQTVSRSGNLVSNTERGLGTGVMISEKGEILTAAHVVQTADNLMVKLVDGSTYSAKVLSTVQYADLALIKLDHPPKALNISKLGDSDNSEVGDPVFVIGTPYGIEHTLTAGYISGKRNMGNGPLGNPLEFIQTDAAINKGNSGGPMFNDKGQLIGIVSHIRSKSGGNEGLGFAASINMAKSQVLERPAFWSGLEFIPVQGRLAKALNISSGAGFVVQSVADNSFASRLGLRASTVPITYDATDFLIGGDIIIRVGDQDILFTEEGLSDLVKKMEEYKAQVSLNITVLREGKEVELSTTLRDDGN